MADANVTTKTCSTCKVSKQLAEFGNHPSGKYGKQACCRACNAVANSKRYWGRHEEYKERSRLAALIYSARHPDKRAASRRAWIERNPDADREAKAKWRANNPEKNKECSRAWSRSHPIEAAAQQQKRRKWVRQNGGCFTSDDVHTMLVAQSGRCNFCLTELTRFHVDHIVPVSKGGANGPSNLQLLCPPCNRKKSDKLPHEVGHLLRYTSLTVTAGSDVRENTRVVLSQYWHKPGIRVTLFHDPEKAPAGGIALSLPLDDFLIALATDSGLPIDQLKSSVDAVLEKVKHSSSPTGA